jgi:hypothetical protein
MNTKELLYTLKPMTSEMIGTRGDGYIRNTYLVDGIPITEDISFLKEDDACYKVCILIPMTEKEGNIIAAKYQGVAIPCNTTNDAYYVCLNDSIAFERALDFVRDRVERKLYGGLRSIAEFKYTEDVSYAETIRKLIQSLLRTHDRTDGIASAVVDVLYAAYKIAWRLV